MFIEQKFKEKVNYEPGDIEFYQKMWRIDPEAAKSWIEKRLNTLVEIQDNIKNEIRQLRDMSNYNEDKKAHDYYNLAGGKKMTTNGDIARKAILDYMNVNVDRNIKIKEIIRHLVSMGLEKKNSNNYIADLVRSGAIKRTGFGLLALPSYKDPQL